MTAVISAGMVKELREMSGAGMMDCKNALTETAGNMEEAIDWLRKKGLSKAAKKSGRIAAEGLVAASLAGTSGVVIEMNSETDFVARNDQFQALVKETAKLALKTPDVEALKAASWPQGGTVADAIANAIATIGENMSLRRSNILTVEAGVVASYIHNAITDGLGKIAVIVALESKGDVAQLNALGRQVAMHVAAANPQALDSSSVDAALMEREKGVLADKARASGKPDAVIAKIVESGLKTLFKEICLVEQPFIHDGSKTVAQALKEAEKTVGAPIVLKGYYRYALGEGIEKEVTDFAAEVAAATKG